MFSREQCHYKAQTMGMLKIHHNNLHQDIKYTCDTCDHQTESKGGLKKHQEEISMHGM